MRWFFALLIFLIPQISTADLSIRFVIAVGNNHGNSREEPLKFAVKDAKRFSEVFTTLGDVKPENAIILEETTVAEIEKAIQNVSQRMQRFTMHTPTVFFFFSGHGDKDSLHLGKETLSRSHLKKLLQQVPGGMKIAVIDACQSLGGARKKGWKVVNSPKITLNPQRAGPEGFIEINSASIGEWSQESDELGGGVFTHYLLSGLKGAADQNGDDRVTLAEIYPYAYHRTIMRTAQAPVMIQRPFAKMNFRGAGPLILTRTAQARSMLLLPKGANIQYFVYHKPSGTVVAEVWGEPERYVKLALTSGRYLIHRRAPGKYGATEVSLAFRGEKIVSPWSFQPFPLKVLAQKGGKLMIHRHEILGNYGFLIGRHGELGHRLTLGYGYRLGPSTICGRLQLGMNDREVSAHTEKNRWIGGDIFLKWNYPFGPLTSSLGLGFSVQYRGRTLDQVEMGREEVNEAPEISGSYFTGGPLIEGSVDIFLGSDVSLNLGATVLSLFFRESSDMSFALDSSIWAGITWGI